MVDFQLSTTHLWTLWTTLDSEPIMRYANLTSNVSGGASCADLSTRWSNVVLESPPDPSFVPGGNNEALSAFDPRQAYLQQLFYPGRFSPQTLAKTVSVSA